MMRMAMLPAIVGCVLLVHTFLPLVPSLPIPHHILSKDLELLFLLWRSTRKQSTSYELEPLPRLFLTWVSESARPVKDYWQESVKLVKHHQRTRAVVKCQCCLWKCLSASCSPLQSLPEVFKLSADLSTLRLEIEYYQISGILLSITCQTFAWPWGTSVSWEP